VAYKVTSYYSSGHDAGILWSDRDLAINWPVEPDSVVLSDKDRRHPLLCELPDYFEYKEVNPAPAAP
jgi:dTDP-4-dehydrorhamnose 3,5-epimerase